MCSNDELLKRHHEDKHINPVENVIANMNCSTEIPCDMCSIVSPNAETYLDHIKTQHQF